MKSLPSNWRNNGTSFEKRIADVAGHYASKGILRLRKVDPPIKTFGGGRVIHLENPFLDFVGSWTCNSGRALFVEAKSTTKPKLIFGDGGLTDKQIEAMRQWQAAGAVVFVLWEYAGAVKMATWSHIGVAMSAKVRHLKWDECLDVPQGQGFILHDFHSVMHLLWR